MSTARAWSAGSDRYCQRRMWLMLTGIALWIAAPVPPCAAQSMFDVRMEQEALPKELRVTLLLRGTESFGLGDAVIALSYDTTRFHRAELVSAASFGDAPYRPVELHTAGDSLYVGVFYDYRTQPGRGARVETAWTRIATIRFRAKLPSMPPMRLLRDAAGVVRDDGVELFLLRD